LIDGQRGWGCNRWREGCRFVIWFETAGRTLTRAQLEMLVTKGKTRKATFADPRGKPIEARLVLDPASAIGVQVEVI
jgi:DNA topoisomerase-3